MNFRENRLLIQSIFLAMTFFFLFGCGNDPEETPPPKKPDPKVVSIDPSVTHQTIAGFGGANQMWGTQFPSASDMQKAFGTGGNELGLSIFRIRIASNPDEWPLIVPVAQEALKHGAKILASPWSPPPALKSNGSDTGGYLPEENYEAFAEHLNDFVEYMASNDVDIYAISIQNEPDIQVSYESCDWTSTAMKNFLKDYGDLITGTKIAAPESFNFSQSFTNTLLIDEESAAQVDIVAGHIYGGGLAAFPIAEEKNKEIWMTEYLMNQGATSNWSQLDASVIWQESLDMASTVHQAMLLNWNAYIWWYLKRYYSFIGDGSQGTASGEILKRGYAFSQFSKFVRPGYIRIDAEDEDNTGLEISAYEGDGKVVVVVVNQKTQAVTELHFGVSGKEAKSALAYTTSLSKNREETTPEVEEGSAVVDIPAKSITTVVISF